MSTTQEKAFDDRVGKVTIAEQLTLANVNCGDIGNTYITPTCKSSGANLVRRCFCLMDILKRRLS